MNRATTGRAALLAVLCSASAAVFAGPGDYLEIKGGLWMGSTSYSNITDHAIGDIPAHGVGPWQNGAVFWATGANTQNQGASITVEVYQVEWRTGRRCFNPPPDGVIRLGAGGIVSHTWCNGPIRLASGSNQSKLYIAEDQVWHNNGEANAGLTVANDLDDKVNNMTIVSDPGVTLTLKETTTLQNLVDTEYLGDIVVQDNSTLFLADGIALKAGTVTQKGPKAKVSFSNAFSQLAETFVLADGARFTVKVGQVWDLTTPLKVTGDQEVVVDGYLCVDGTKLQVDIAEGATLTLKAAVYDLDDQPVAVENIGTGTLNLMTVTVADEPPAENPLVVGPGVQLNVLGNGLTSACAVELNGGTIRVVKDGAIVAAPITITADVAGRTNHIEVAKDAEGVFTGALTHENAAKTLLRIEGEGTKIFTGADASFKNDCRFHHVAGTVVVSNATWAIEGSSNSTRVDCQVRDEARLFCFGEGGKLTAKNSSLKINGAKNGGGAVLEFGEGSEYYTPSAADIVIVSETEADGTLRVTGGYLHDNYCQGSVTICSHCYGRRARLEFYSGTIQLVTPINMTHAPATADYAHPVFYWKGGTLRAEKGSNFSTYAKRFFKGNGRGSLEVIIDGPDCILDVGHSQLDEIGLTEDPTSDTGCAANCHCTENGVLTLTNSTKRAGRLLVHNAFTNMNLRLCKDAGVRVADGTKLYPYSFDSVTKAGEGALGNIVLPAGEELAAGTLKGGAGVAFGAADLAGWTYSNLGFEPGAIYAFRSNGGIAETLTVPGKIFLPEQMYFVAEADKSLAVGGCAVLTATGGIEGEGALDPFPGSRRLIYSVKDDSVVFEQRGLTLLLR